MKDSSEEPNSDEVYLEQATSVLFTDDNIDKGCPESLYRYYPPLTDSNKNHIKKLFVNSEIYFSKPSDFNDPFEVNGFSYYNKQELESEFKEKNIAVSEEEHQKINTEFNVLCSYIELFREASIWGHLEPAPV